MNDWGITKLTARLQNALDSDFNVIDPATVLLIISQLEGTTITKEQLEATRLAKYINQLRRKTSDQQLARRSKNLLKKWRDMITPALTHSMSSVSSVSLSQPQSPVNLIQQFASSAGVPSRSSNQFEVPSKPPTLPAGTTITVIPRSKEQPTSFSNVLNAVDTRARGQPTPIPSPSALSANAVPLFVINDSRNSVLDFQDSNSNSTFTKQQNPALNPQYQGGKSQSKLQLPPQPDYLQSSTRDEHRKSKKHKKDKKRSRNSPNHDVNSPSSHQSSALLVDPNSRNRTAVMTNNDEGSLFSRSASFQVHDSLSNSSMSLFPSTTTTITQLQSNNNSRLLTTTSGPLQSLESQSDLTFAGKFKKTAITPPDLPEVEFICMPPSTTTITLIDDEHSRHSLSASSKAIGPSAPMVAAVVATALDAQPPPVKRGRGRPRKINPIVAPNSNHVIIIGSRSSSPIMSSANNSNDSFASALNPISDLNQPLQIGAASIGDVKMPKKRGRKKGSKGVDGVLAQQSNNFFESAPFLKMSSFKKVKTTKELLAEIQNRKLGSSATSSPTLVGATSISNPVPSPTSSTSDASMQSHSNSDFRSTSATPQSMSMARSTPDLPNAVPSSFKAGGDVDDFITDSNETGTITSNATATGIKLENSLAAKNKRITASGAKASQEKSIDDEISEILTQLPPIDYEKLQIYFQEYQSDDNNLPCLCTVHEVEPPKPTELTIETKQDISVVSVPTVGEEKSDSVKLKSEPDLLFGEIKEEKIPMQFSATSRSPLPPKKLVKSIFDLDYDEDEDPLHSFVEAAKTFKILKENHEENSSSSQSVAKIEESSSETNERRRGGKSDVVVSIPVVQPLAKVDNVAILPPSLILEQQPEQPLFPTYEVVEHPDCPAKKRHEIQAVSVTRYHINALHNRFIPIVNGDWSDGPIENLEECDDGTSKISHLHEILPNGLYSRVLPDYNYPVLDRLPKDLSLVKFTKNYSVKREKQLAKLATLKDDEILKRARKRRRTKSDTKVNDSEFVSKFWKDEGKLKLFSQNRNNMQTDCARNGISLKNEGKYFAKSLAAVAISAMRDEDAEMLFAPCTEYVEKSSIVICNKLKDSLVNSDSFSIKNIIKSNDIINMYDNNNRLRNANNTSRKIFTNNNLNTRFFTESNEPNDSHSLNTQLKNEVEFMFNKCNDLNNGLSLLSNPDMSDRHYSFMNDSYKFSDSSAERDEKMHTNKSFNNIKIRLKLNNNSKKTKIIKISSEADDEGENENQDNQSTNLLFNNNSRSSNKIHQDKNSKHYNTKDPNVSVEDDEVDSDHCNDHDFIEKLGSEDANDGNDDEADDDFDEIPDNNDHRKDYDEEADDDDDEQDNYDDEDDDDDDDDDAVGGYHHEITSSSTTSLLSTAANPQRIVLTIKKTPTKINKFKIDKKCEDYMNNDENNDNLDDIDINLSAIPITSAPIDDDLDGMDTILGGKTEMNENIFDSIGMTTYMVAESVENCDITPVNSERKENEDETKSVKSMKSESMTICRSSGRLKRTRRRSSCSTLSSMPDDELLLSTIKLSNNSSDDDCEEFESSNCQNNFQLPSFNDINNYWNFSGLRYTSSIPSSASSRPQKNENVLNTELAENAVDSKQQQQYLQQFKEWHEVVQCRSYNDELLTILPYTVID